MNDNRSPLELVTEALHFAAEKHAGQRRKGASAEPYVNHVAEVACLLAQATRGTDANLVAAGLLHDVVEDTGATRDDIANTFGDDVASLVMEVTDDKSLPKPERKRLQVVHAPTKSARAKLIKLADKTSNLRAIAESPPANWDTKRCEDYLDWAQDVAAGLRGVSAELEAKLDDAERKARAALAAR
jgi:guanosine-3',5'-bis(diphosphate) 3'-pyrophosphohydrolase